METESPHVAYLKKLLAEHRARIAPGRWGAFCYVELLSPPYSAVFNTEAEAVECGKVQLDKMLADEPTERRADFSKYFADNQDASPVVIDHRKADGTLVPGRGWLSWLTENFKPSAEC